MKITLHDISIVLATFVTGAVSQLALSSQPFTKVALFSALSAGAAAVVNKYFTRKKDQ